MAAALAQQGREGIMATVAAPASASLAEALARFLVAEHGFRIGFVDEAEVLVGACDIILTRLDPMNFAIACLMDGERNTGQAFPLDAARLRAVASACLIHTGTPRGTGRGVTVHVFEIGPGATARPHRAALGRFKAASPLAPVRIYGWAIDPLRKTVWLGRPLARLRGQDAWIRRFVVAPEQASAAPQRADTAPKRRRSRFRRCLAVLALVLAIGAAAAVTIMPLMARLQRQRLEAELYAPWPASEAQARLQSAAMIAAKPRDPRARFVHALELFDTRDLKGAEHDLRVSLDAGDLLQILPLPGFEARLRMLLAAVLIDEGRRDDARTVAGPACGSEPQGPVRAGLDRLGLCG